MTPTQKMLEQRIGEIVGELAQFYDWANEGDKDYEPDRRPEPLMASWSVLSWLRILADEASGEIWGPPLALCDVIALIRDEKSRLRDEREAEEIWSE